MKNKKITLGKVIKLYYSSAPFVSKYKYLFYLMLLNLVLAIYFNDIPSFLLVTYIIVATVLFFISAIDYPRIKKLYVTSNNIVDMVSKDIEEKMEAEKNK